MQPQETRKKDVFTASKIFFSHLINCHSGPVVAPTIPALSVFSPKSVGLKQYPCAWLPMLGTGGLGPVSAVTGY